MRQRRFSSQRQGENFLTVILVCSPPYARGYVNSYVHVHAFAMCRHVTLDPADCANAQRHQQPQSRVHPDRQRSWGQSFDYGPNMNLFIHLKLQLTSLFATNDFVGNFLTSDIMETARSGRTRSMMHTGYPYFLYVHSNLEPPDHGPGVAGHSAGELDGLSLLNSPVSRS